MMTEPDYVPEFLGTFRLNSSLLTLYWLLVGDPLEKSVSPRDEQ